MITLIALLRLWFGEGEYYDAWHKESHTLSFAFRFWRRVAVSFAGLCFFIWQQIVEPHTWWGSDAFATIVLVLTASQAAGPLFYLLWRVTKRVFLTESYLEALRDGRFPVSVTSVCCIALMTVLSIVAATGLLGVRWYVKPLVFFLTVPVACFWVFLPMLNWIAVRVRRIASAT